MSGRERRLQASLLDPTQRLHLEGLSMGAPLSVVFVFTTMPVALHDVLVTTVTWELVANPTAGRKKNQNQKYQAIFCIRYDRN